MKSAVGRFVILLIFVGSLPLVSGCGMMWMTVSEGSGSSSGSYFGNVQAQQIYRSVGPGNTSVLACGGTDGSGCLEVGGNLTINQYGATFASPLPNNVGVGDVIVYDSTGNGALGIGDSVAFISGRVSNTEYRVQNSSGAMPTSYGPASVWRIYRAYTSIQNAMAGFHSENTSIIAINNTLGWFDVGFNNNNNLTTVGFPWSIALYGDAMDAYTAINLDIIGWTTSPADQLRIYAPYLSTEVGVTQRHSGVWTSNVATISFPAGFFVQISESNFIFDGIQITEVASPGGGDCSLLTWTGAWSNIALTNNLLNGTGSTGNFHGICNQNNVAGLYIINNIAYNYPKYGLNIGGGTLYAYNNTIVNSGVTGFYLATAGSVSAKNNIITGSGTSDYGTSNPAQYLATVDNLSGDATSPNAALRSLVVTFVNAGLPDYRLSPTDASALNAGTSLASDPNYSFSTDITAISRPQGSGWDIGASEAVPATSNATEILILSFGTTATTFTATATFNGDNNSNNSATIYYCNNTVVPGCNPLTQGVSAGMARGAGNFSYVASGLISGDTYTVEVITADSDGVSGSIMEGSVTP